MANTIREPRTKAEFMQRVLSYDFSGDIRTLSPEGARITRTGTNRLEVLMPMSGIRFELVVRRPRSEEYLEKARTQRAEGASRGLKKRKSSKDMSH